MALGCRSGPSASKSASAADAGPLESQPPAIVAPDQRKSAASSPVVFDPMRGRVWTANGDVGTVGFVDIDTGHVLQEIALGTDIRSIALSPDAKWVAAVDRAGASVALVDADTRQVRRNIALGSHPRSCVWDAANPKWLYVTMEDEGSVAVVDRTLGQLAATVDVGRLPSGLAVSSAQQELYVTHRIDPDVTVVTLPDRQVAADIALADEPFSDPATPNGKPFGFESLALTADGHRAWVPHELLAPTHPFVFNQTLFPAISVVDLVGRSEVQTNPNDPAGAISGRKNLFNAIAANDPDGQRAVFSQICAAALHPNGIVAWAIACASEDLLTFSVPAGQLVNTVRSPGGEKCNHPTGLTLDDTGQRLFVLCDQSHTLLTFDTANGSPVGHLTLLGSPLSLVASDPVDPELRAGLTLFFRANSSKGTMATTGHNWMSCGGCHLDGFTSNNLRLFESLAPHDPQYDAEMGHGFCGPSAAGPCIRLGDHFSTAPTPASPTFDPHDVLVALLDQGGLTADRSGTLPDAQIPAQPTPDQTQMAGQLARVVARDLPRGPTWLGSSGGPPNLDQDTAFCGKCHQAEYDAWTKSVHAHSAEDPMVLYGVGVEQGLAGTQFSRLCAGCHDPASARAGDFSLQSKRGVTCLGCHEVDRPIRAGGNGDLASATYDWTVDHKARALASLDQLRKPEFCGGCHQQFVPGTGLVAIGTLDEYHASPYVGRRACIDCHMSKDNKGVANHRAPGGNVFLGQMFGDDVLVGAQKVNLTQALSLQAQRVSGGVLVTVFNSGAAHSFPTGVTDIREPWVELQAKDASGNVLAHVGGPVTDKDLLPDGAARLGIDLAAPDGTVLLRHELTLATRVPFDARVPANEAVAFYLPLPPALPTGSASLDAVLSFRNVRTTYYRAATGDASGAAPTVELARTQVP
jgi:predicted CXXCH cytochrome family protein